MGPSVARPLGLLLGFPTRSRPRRSNAGDRRGPEATEHQGPGRSSWRLWTPSHWLDLRFRRPVLQKPTDGTGRRPASPRPARRVSLVSRMNRRSVAAVRSLRGRFGGRTAASTGSLRTTLAAAIRPFATAERALPIVVAAIVAVASLLALLPSTPAGATGATQGSGQGLRLAVNGGIRYLDATDDPAALAQLDAQKAAPQSFQPVTLPGDITNAAIGAAGPRRRGRRAAGRHPGHRLRTRHDRRGRFRPDPDVPRPLRRHAVQHLRQVQRLRQDAVVGEQDHVADGASTSASCCGSRRSTAWS